MSLDFDSRLIDFLCKCKLLHLRERFIGVQLRELVNLLNTKPVKHVKERLRQILPSDTTNLETIIKTIVQELEDEDHDDPLEKKIKIEKYEIKTEPDTDGDDDIEILDEIPGDVSVEKVITRDTSCIEIKEEVGNDLALAVDVDNSNNSTLLVVASTSNFNVHRIAGSSARTCVTPTMRKHPSKQQRYIILNIIEELEPENYNADDNEDISADSDDISDRQEKMELDNSTRKRKLGRKKKNESRDNSDWGFVVNWYWRDWLMDWSIEQVDFDFDFPEVHELHIFAECENPGTMLPRLLCLPNLKSLEIKHDGFVNYGQELTNIVKGAGGNLEEIHFIHDADDSLPIFLSILKNIDPPFLNKLIYLQIESCDAEVQPVALVLEQLEMLSEIKVNVPNLRELFLGHSLWDDCKPGLEKVLQIFSTVTHFTVKGCFVTKSKVQPSITINFPSEMPNLEMLEFGGYYKYASTFENQTDRPLKKKIFHIARREDGREITQERDDQEQEDSHGEVFSVLLNLPVLPKLKSLVLGCLYDTQDLHFSKMKELEIFRVSSPWDGSVKFPKPERNKVYPTLKEMQFPDYFQDFTFIQSTISYFPHVSKWYFNLPSVNVIRAFAHCMKNANRSLELLDIKIQYDFPSSLDWIILNEPWRTVTQTRDELNKIRTLHQYPHWEEYAKVNQIQIPNHSDPEVEMTTADDGSVVKRWSGLEVLAKKFTPARKNDKTLKLKVIPRTLRLPKGEHHFNDDQCEFTNTLIGFQNDKYPFSARAWSKTPKGIQVSRGFDMSKVSYKKVNICDDQSDFIVDHSPRVSKAESRSQRDEPS